MPPFLIHWAPPKLVYFVARQVSAVIQIHRWFGSAVFKISPHRHTACSQQTRGIHPILFPCWPTVFDAGPTLKQDWVFAAMEAADRAEHNHRKNAASGNTDVGLPASQQMADQCWDNVWLSCTLAWMSNPGFDKNHPCRWKHHKTCHQDVYLLPCPNHLNFSQSSKMTQTITQIRF